MSLRPRRASTFFRKESRQRFARGRGSAPFEPPFQRPAADLPFPRAAGRLSGPSGRKPPADGETLEKPGSRAQLFKRFCAKGNACALRPISPFLSLLAGLRGLSGRKPPAGMGNARKAKEQSSAFRAFLCVGERSAPRYSFQNGSLARAFARPQGTGDRLPACPGKQEPGVGLHMEPIAGVRGWAKTQTRCASCPAQPRSKKPRSKAQLFKRFCAKGDAPGLFPCPGKQEPGVGPHPEPAAGVRGWVQPQTRCASCSPQARSKKPRSRAQLFKRFCAWGMRRSFCPARENRSSAQAHTRKEPRACETRGRKRHGARLAHRRCARRSRKAPADGRGFFIWNADAFRAISPEYTHSCCARRSGSTRCRNHSTGPQ